MNEIAHLMCKYDSTENLELNLLTLAIVPLLSCIFRNIDTFNCKYSNSHLSQSGFAKMYTGKPVRHLCVLWYEQGKDWEDIYKVWVRKKGRRWGKILNWANTYSDNNPTGRGGRDGVYVAGGVCVCFCLFFLTG